MRRGRRCPGSCVTLSVRHFQSLPSGGSKAYPTPWTVLIISGPSLCLSALTWESTVRVPDASTQSHTSSRSFSRVSTCLGLRPKVARRSNSVGVRWICSPRNTTSLCAGSITRSGTSRTVSFSEFLAITYARSTLRSSALHRATSSRMEKGLVI